MSAHLPATADTVVTRLRDAGCVFAEDEARLLRRGASDPAVLDELVTRRCAGMPLEQLLGWAAFGDLPVVVADRVFVPRPRSTFLARSAAACCPPGAVVVDLCCGSGAIGAAIATARPDVEVHAVDIDPRAVVCARRNLAHARGRVYTGDLYRPVVGHLCGQVDVIVANAPYVPSAEIDFLPAEAREHEPRHALDGGKDGIDLHRRISAGACAWLRSGGRLLIETSGRQAALTASTMREHGLRAHITYNEDTEATVVVGIASGAARRRRRSDPANPCADWVRALSR